MQETGEMFSILKKKKKKDNQQLQNDTDVEIIKFIGAILIMFQEIKVNTLEMDEKIDVLRRDTTYKKETSENFRN